MSHLSLRSQSLASRWFFSPTTTSGESGSFLGIPSYIKCLQTDSSFISNPNLWSGLLILWQSSVLSEAPCVKELMPWEWAQEIPQAMLSSTHGWNLICCYSQFSGENKKKAQPLRLCAASFTWPQVKTLATADDLTSVLGTYVIGENQLAYVASWPP